MRYTFRLQCKCCIIKLGVLVNQFQAQNLGIPWESHSSFCNRKKVSNMFAKLTKHQQSNTEKKSFKCKICENVFTKLSTLTVHKRSHTGEKPFKCDNCENAFTTSSHLTRHN